MTAPLSDKRRTGRIDAHVLEAIYLEHLGKLVRESSMDAVVLLAHERVHDPDPFERDWQFKPALLLMRTGTLGWIVRSVARCLFDAALPPPFGIERRSARSTLLR